MPEPPFFILTALFSQSDISRLFLVLSQTLCLRQRFRDLKREFFIARRYFFDQSLTCHRSYVSLLARDRLAWGVTILDYSARGWRYAQRRQQRGRLTSMIVVFNASVISLAGGQARQ